MQPHKPNAPAALLTATALLLCVCLPGCGDQAPAPSGTATDADADTPAATHSEKQPNPVTNAPEHALIDAEAFTALRAQAQADGKVLVVDCWATWCPSCLVMFPKLHAAMKERGDQVRLVSVCFDEGEDYIEKAGAYLSKQKAWEDAYLLKAGAEQKEAFAEATGSEDFGGTVLPAVFVYGPGGELAYEMLETEGEPADWVASIAAAADQAADQAAADRAASE